VTAFIEFDRSWASTQDVRPKPIHFCSRCGHPSEEPPGRAMPRRRVCQRCGMGMVLSCPREALPGDAAPFLICTHDLVVSAVSQAGERIFGKEERLVGSHLLEHVTSPLGDDQLARHAEVAAQREIDPLVMPLRLVSTAKAGRFGTLAARIASCGPPRGALLTVEPSGFGRRA
jgi:hypothetical protein